MPLTIVVQPIKNENRPWIRQFLHNHWGSSRVVSRGHVHHADVLPGFIAYPFQEDQQLEQVSPGGLITYNILGHDCEIVTLDSLVGGIGVGTRLILAVESAARASGCRRLWLITTNDNTKALKFYQKRGFTLVALYRDAIHLSRLLKPEIPLTGIDNIPIRDEIELEKFIPIT
jgi:GNAT superfamily N-acetyltransferase